MKTCDLTIRDLLFPDGRRADLTIDRGTVVHCGAGLRAAETIDARGMLLLPAGTDMHVHMRDWSQSYKEDWETGSQCALAGGVTLVVDQPNTVPPLVTAQRVVERINRAQSCSLCHFAINGGLDNAADLPGLWNAGVMAFGELFAAPSSYGEGLSKRELSLGLSKIHDLGGLATIHAETITGEYPADLEMHNDIRSCKGEAGAVREVLHACQAGSRIHFCHLSNAEAVNAAHDDQKLSEGSASRSVSMGNNRQVTVEATPHHLLLSYEDFSPEDTEARVNPPLRSKREQHDLLGAWDKVDVIASDHAPHTSVEKAVPFAEAPSGMPGVETMIPVLLAYVREKKMDLGKLIEKTCTRPCEILGIPAAGWDKGRRTDFALYPSTPVRVDPDMLHSRAGWSPFEGRPAMFPEIVVMNGEVVYQSGVFTPGSPRWYPGPGWCDSNVPENK
jgi:dihydroorotase